MALPKPSAGALNRRIILERYTETRDEYNAVVKGWVALASRAAAYEPLTDGERLRGDQLLATATGRFVIRCDRSLRDLNPKDRLTFEGVIHEIQNVKQIGTWEFLEITTKARADGGV